MLSALYGWLSLKTWRTRGILVASAIPLAMLGNMVRMIILAIGCVWFGSDFAIGRNINGHQEMSFYHSLAGFMVFGVALAGMFGLCTWMEKTLDRRPPPSAQPPRAAPPLSAVQAWSQLGATILILGGGLYLCSISDVAYHVGPAGVNPKMPGLLAGYASVDQPMTAREKSTLAEDVRIERRLYTRSDRAILSTIVLSGAEKRSLHSPDDCLPAQGWMVANKSLVPLDLGNGFTPTASLMTMYRDVEDASGRRVRLKALNMFWYLGSDGTSSAGYEEHIWRTYFDALVRNLNHRWALLTFFVPLKTEASGFEDPFAEIQALEDMKEFIRLLMPFILVREKGPSS
jgi:exosortase/archaeosortase family protein